MRIGFFTAIVDPGKERSTGHVALKHGDVYTLKLVNHDRSRRADAEVRVDGKDVGCFRIEAGGAVNIERPENDSGRFTFYKAASLEGEQAGAPEVDAGDRGLVTVRFKPEVRHRAPDVVRPRSMLQSTNLGSTTSDYDGTVGASLPRNMSAGVTGLTGTSGQNFYAVAPLDYDVSAEVTINLRLVCDGEVRKLVSRSNQVPSPAE